jgi:adenosylmethionine-8-amino-7-oxononanoate aminotransferase
MLRPLGDCLVIMPPVAIGLDLLDMLLEATLEACRNSLPEIAAAAART